MMTSDQVKAGLYIAAALGVVYVGYRVYKLGESAKESVSESLDRVGGWFGNVYKAVVPASVRAPDLDELPSNDGYPDARQIRDAVKTEYDGDGFAPWNMPVFGTEDTPVYHSAGNMANESPSSVG